ncbi:MAG: DEAD/DEAH box helicase [Marinagarivorans sp.]|nr:DEAD/DEAH box helicase [Marinagarivorans sp.]
MIISADTEKNVDNAYAAYLKLNANEKIMLQLLAVLYRPIGLTVFNKILTAIKKNKVLGAVTVTTLTPELKEKLMKSNYLAQNNEGLILNPYLHNRLTEETLAAGYFLKLINISEEINPYRTNTGWQRKPNADQLLIRDLYYINNNNEKTEKIEKLMAVDKNPQIIDLYANDIFIGILFIPFNLERFLELPYTIQYQSFASLVLYFLKDGDPITYPVSLIEQVCQQQKQAGNYNLELNQLLGELYILQARFDDAKRIIAIDDASCYGLQLNAALLFLEGHTQAAQTLFEKAIVAKNKYTRRKNQYLGGTLGLIYKLCLCAQGSQQSVALYDQAIDQMNNERSDKNSDDVSEFINNAIRKILRDLNSGNVFDLRTTLYINSKNTHKVGFHLSLLLELLGEIWCNGEINKKSKTQLKECQTFFKACNLGLFEHITEQIATWPKTVKNSAHELIHFPSLISRKAEWDIALEKLIALSPQTNSDKTATATKAAEKCTRLIWEMSLYHNEAIFKAREQTKTTKGWSKGRPAALKRLHDDYLNITHLSDADKKMCRAIEVYQNWGYYASVDYLLQDVSALIAAKDLDNLYLSDDLDNPIELIQQEPELLISQKGQQLLLSMADLPSPIDESDDVAYSIKENGSRRFVFTVFNKSHLKVGKIIGEGGLMIPLHAKEKVLQSVSAIAPLLNIQSDMDGLNTGLETIEGIKDLIINIAPLGEGLEFTCVIMPFGEQGPIFKPIAGNANITTEINGKRIATQRDLINEQHLLDALDEHCPHFLAMADNTLAQDDLQSALETLEQLESVVNKNPMPFAVQLRWPKGKKFTLTKKLESHHLDLAINKKNEWFDLTGALSVDENQVLELRKLLALVAASHGRFVTLDNGQVLALSQDLRKKLDQLNHATDAGKFHPLAGLHVAEATTGMRMKTLHAWDEQSKKMHEANKIKPKVPKTLQADLRDYQHEGFDWMSRLAHWGAGACLADDMGLGKTLQALAVLLARASEGPCLVIAPTSVCFNWQQEALKFAPTLNIKFFSDSTTTEQRSELLNNLSAFDCVIISYGLLQRESDILAQVQWHTIVADEAQALKNPTTKRSQAACALKADFKIITTGTPIENNLTELWSLFRFVNPGLLGNIKTFGKRFALPIENAKDDKLAAKHASLGLKTLIQPFILRRMKNQVLTELPSRTDINIHVELSKEEQLFYEALRRNAVDNILKATKTANSGEQRIRMLAELVKLRQACCNPKLVMAETDLPSAKLAALDELLDELQQNNHKALIFSQFVGHLQLIKQHLEKRKISYQYLDGSTPQKDRAKRVNAFQGGEGDVFLISLKAGGSGLNLTAADYVIHMDPWWNPAVEEQASDRAHRMGQQRPVTIYRLIAKNTIEEKIVALHQHKRDLADKLLEGNEQATQLSVDDMLSMLKETF